MLLSRCESLGYVTPTPIQEQAIPLVMQGEDLIACAETGTGKTAAFLLPILQKLIENKPKGTAVLVLAPTRELANQTEQACRDLAPKNIRCAILIGGTGYRSQENALRRGADIIVATPGRLRISVTDTGEGLAPDKLAQLFQPFNRLGQEASVEEGTGIGLVVAKRLVEWMGGVIGVESEVGKGSVFWIELELTTGSQPVAGAAGPADVVPAQAQADTPLRTLLYVEDNPANLMLVEDLVMRRPDIRLLSARDGSRGVEVARAALPDVILMDINLPGISGVDALRILAEDPATAHIPVIALSANAIPRDIAKGLEAGFFRYLTKPIKVNEFMATLDVALKFAQTHPARANGEKTA